jgi:DNA-binding PucR family transcriptional regulator
MKRIWTDENDRQRIYIDVGEGNEVVDFMARNSIFVEKENGNVLTYNTAQFSLYMTAGNLKALVEFYKRHGWEVTEDVQAITDDFVKRAQEERERREEEQLRLWMEEQERQKKILQPQLYKVRLRQHRGYKGILY